MNAWRRLGPFPRVLVSIGLGVLAWWLLPMWGEVAIAVAYMAGWIGARVDTYLVAHR
jgi:hypothetical protein